MGARKLESVLIFCHREELKRLCTLLINSGLYLWGTFMSFDNSSWHPPSWIVPAAVMQWILIEANLWLRLWKCHLPNLARSMGFCSAQKNCLITFRRAKACDMEPGGKWKRCLRHSYGLLSTSLCSYCSWEWCLCCLPTTAAQMDAFVVHREPQGKKIKELTRNTKNMHITSPSMGYIEFL